MVGDSAPVVPRFSAWGQWRPLVATCSFEEFCRVQLAAESLSSAAAKAVLYYCSYTEFSGIEFVVVSTVADEAPYRRYPNGIVLVPCTGGTEPRPTVWLYDGWMPLADHEHSTIAAGLKAIDETVSFATHILGGSARWIVKYSEVVNGLIHNAHITDEDHQRLEKALGRLRGLPPPIQDAVVRSVHWMQHGSRQLRPTDAVLALWQALESLMLALYEFAPDLGLALPAHRPSLSRTQRRKQRAQHVARILQEEALEPEQGVRRAYFEAIVPIRGRCEEVLVALLGADERIAQLYDRKAAWCPNAIRNAILHEGRSALEIEAACDVPARYEFLRRMLGELIARVLGRLYAGEALPTRSQTFSTTMNPFTMLPCSPGGGVKVVGDFSITLGLLAAKGLL